MATASWCLSSVSAEIFQRVPAPPETDASRRTTTAEGVGARLEESASPADVGLKRQEVQRVGSSAVEEDGSSKSPTKPREAKMSRRGGGDHPVTQSGSIKTTQSEKDSEVEPSLPGLGLSELSPVIFGETEKMRDGRVPPPPKEADLPSDQVGPPAEVAPSKREAFLLQDGIPPNTEGNKKTQGRKLEEASGKQRQLTGSSVRRQEAKEDSTQKSTFCLPSETSPSSRAPVPEETSGVKEEPSPAAETSLPTNGTSVALPRAASAFRQNVPTEEATPPKKPRPKGQSGAAPPKTRPPPAQNDVRPPQTTFSGGARTETKPGTEEGTTDQAEKGTGILVDLSRSGSWFF